MIYTHSYNAGTITARKRNGKGPFYTATPGYDGYGVSLGTRIPTYADAREVLQAFCDTYPPERIARIGEVNGLPYCQALCRCAGRFKDKYAAGGHGLTSSYPPATIDA